MCNDTTGVGSPGAQAPSGILPTAAPDAECLKMLFGSEVGVEVALQQELQLRRFQAEPGNEGA